MLHGADIFYKSFKSLILPISSRRFIISYRFIMQINNIRVTHSNTVRNSLAT